MRLRAVLLIAIAALLGGPFIGLPTAAPGPGGAVGCADPVFDAPVRATTARSSAPRGFAEAVRRNGGAADEVRAASVSDSTLWLDQCGTAFYRDAAPQPRSAAASADPTLPASTDVLALASRPGAARTIHLDFRGESVRGTAWNQGDVGDFVAAPFTADADPDSFSQTERLQIYKAWLTVAEDYAPFDVNVTTAETPTAAITRSGSTDTTYGTRVVVSEAPELADDCRCAGVAYVDVFDTERGHAYYQPAWVFTGGSGLDGWDIGEVASHEAGHNLGLLHDGDARSGYHSGSDNWAPIMGAAYGKALSQFSRGEYAGATEDQDDLAVIAASGAPFAADDHGDTRATATSLPSGTTLRGTIGSATDRDAFVLTDPGEATVRVRPQGDSSNLDVDLTILDAGGTQVARVNPRATARSAANPAPGWLGATWTGDLPGTGPWTVLVDGAGQDDPAAGGWSDYGSLGRYTIQATVVATAGEDPVEPPAPQPEPETEPEATLVFRTASALPDARVGRAYRRTILLAGPEGTTVRRSAGSLPRGMGLSADGLRVLVTGTSRAATTARFTLRATSPEGQVVVRTFRLRVVR